MTLHVKNSLTGEREVFEPEHDEEVLMYVCGLTVSDEPHIGHARVWIHADVMHRWLEYLGYSVRHVENITDVNEKIVAKINDIGNSESEVAETYTSSVIEAMRGLNLKRAEVYPRVSEHISEIIDLTQTLIDKGYAYEASGSVYFDVTTFDDYGKLSNQTIDEMEAQGPPEEREEKRHPEDFALWKAGIAHPDNGEPGGETWASPWSEGRPGWHIECSAMSMTHLDETIDIHIGGQDLVFPHHENEIAQSEAATEQQFVKYWLHVGLLETAGEKMSTSLGNFTIVEDALREHGMNPVRMFLISTTFDNRQTHSSESVQEAIGRWERLSRAHERSTNALDSTYSRSKKQDESFRNAIKSAREDFIDGMNDNFNTRKALRALEELETAIHTYIDDNEVYDYTALREAVETLETFGGDILGFDFGQQESTNIQLAEELIELILEIREEERAAGNYERADALRSELEGLGIEVEDEEDGTVYRF
ncbi:MAG: cysteine--tRNA ligase [Halobacteriaceae archaeon]